MSAKIIIATVGSLGDLHPFIAIGLALKAKGARPVLALPAEQVEKARASGLEAEAVMPSLADLGTAGGTSFEKFTADAVRKPGAAAGNVILPSFAPSYQRLLPLAKDADMITGSSYFFAGSAVAETLGLPYVSMLLQPLPFLSMYDPPYLKEYPVFFLHPNGPLRRTWNRTANVILVAESYRRFALKLNKLRKDVGLSPYPGLPFFGVPGNSLAPLGLYSPLLGDVQPDFPEGTKLTGFPRFDSETGRNDDLPADLAAFLDAGEAPIVFTLGSFAVHAPGDFYAIARAAARKLGRRALLLTGNDDRSLVDTDCCVAKYAPHSAVFPRAAAIVHHAGIGTAGQALHSGRPQLIVPYLGDQPDNARRIKRLGAGDYLSPHLCTADRLAARIDALLSDPEKAKRAQEVADIVRKENGAEAAADHLLSLFAKRKTA